MFKYSMFKVDLNFFSLSPKLMFPMLINCNIIHLVIRARIWSHPKPLPFSHPPHTIKQPVLPILPHDYFSISSTLLVQFIIIVNLEYGTVHWLDPHAPWLPTGFSILHCSSNSLSTVSEIQIWPGHLPVSNFAKVLHCLLNQPKCLSTM